MINPFEIKFGDLASLAGYNIVRVDASQFAVNSIMWPKVKSSKDWDGETLFGGMLMIDDSKPLFQWEAFSDRGEDKGWFSVKVRDKDLTYLVRLMEDHAVKRGKSPVCWVIPDRLREFVKSKFNVHSWDSDEADLELQFDDGTAEVIKLAREEEMVVQNKTELKYVGYKEDLVLTFTRDELIGVGFPQDKDGFISPSEVKRVFEFEKVEFHKTQISVY